MRRAQKHAVFVTVCILGIVLQACQTTHSGSLSQKDPEKSVKVRTQLAAEYIRSGDLNAAKRALDQALNIEPRDSSANMMMGVLLQYEGSPQNLEKADTYFKRSIAVDSKNAQARNNYGTYLYEQKRYNDAINQFNIAGATLGYDQRYRAFENLGRVYLKLNDIVNAEKSFKQALQVNRDSAVSMLELSDIYYLRKQMPNATNLYEQYVRVVGQNNQSARVLWLGIRIARANGDNMGMQALINQLRALYPESQEFKRYLQLQYSTEAVWK
ncbi:type IV pilus biogenesis/stability protein PilW [Acinetobacter stercoris]|uniref:Cellulose synthase subunit BcsC n=1 Tax=Acinetobacter stercoris TaxID=2126983 RepID=A0A2U3MX77_9GAMM|nr:MULTISPECIES: type IV pilus biogenesis/stability protein PilW [Acinetobacter]SPL69963.1 cellulose synthase subunit BcsC [Acinetobacter stercoris]